VEKVGRAKVQLLGVSALMVASKYEEVTIPQLSQYLEAMDGAYGKEDLLGMERSILKAVGLAYGVYVSQQSGDFGGGGPGHDGAGDVYNGVESMEYPALDYRASLLPGQAPALPASCPTAPIRLLGN